MGERRDREGVKGERVERKRWECGEIRGVRRGGESGVGERGAR